MAISTIGTNSLASTAQIGSLATASGSAPSYSARAWVNFNGVGTVAIRASGNVSSITDNGAGDYTVNFSIAMSDANYSSNVTSNNGSPSSAGNFLYIGIGYTATSSTYRFNTGSTGSAWADCASINVTVFR